MVTLELTDQQAKNLHEILHYVRDEGPEGESWQSEELVEIRRLVDLKLGIQQVQEFVDLMADSRPYYKDLTVTGIEKQPQPNTVIIAFNNGLRERWVGAIAHKLLSYLL